MYVLLFISPIYLSVIFSNSSVVRSHRPSDNGFIVAKQNKLGQGWARIGSLPVLLDMYEWPKRFLEVTFIFTLDFEIVPAVWGFIFVSIVK
jgi:hypothetical protein